MMNKWKETVENSLTCEKNYLAFQAQEFKKSKYWHYFSGGVSGMAEFRQNQKGIALVTVIIVITVVSIIVTSLLNVSVMSYQRKTMDYRSKDTFYATEAAMDEVNVGLQKVVADNLQYWTTPAQFMANVRHDLGGSTTNAATYLTNIINGSSWASQYTNGDLQVSVGGISNGADGRSVKLENVNIKYRVTDGADKGYYSEIETDIVLSVPKATSSVPVGSYATVAGSGMAVSSSRQSYIYNAGNCECTGSIHVGYKENVQSVASYTTFADQLTHWEALNIDNFSRIKFSGDMTDINGNLKVGDYGVVTFAGAQANVYGNILLGEHATVIIDKDCQFKCHGIYVKQGGSYVPYNTVSEAAATDLCENQLNFGSGYTGHVPYTYPYRVSIFQYKKAGGSYPLLDSTYEWYSNCNKNLPDDKYIYCFQNGASGDEDSSNVRNHHNLYTMKNPIQKSVVLVGTPCNAANGYKVYGYANQVNPTAYSAAFGTNSNALNSSVGYDFSGVCYPLVINGTGTHTWEYGSGGMTNINKNGSVTNITIDSSMAPNDKVASKYLSYTASDYDNVSRFNSIPTSQLSNIWYDDVLYGFMELEYAEAYSSSDLKQFSDYKTSSSKLAKQLSVANSQVANAPDTIMYVQKHGGTDVPFNDMNNMLYNILAFTDSTISMQIKEACVIQPFITKSQMNAIEGGDDELKAVYDEWGSRPAMAKGSTCDAKYLTSDYRSGKNVYIKNFDNANQYSSLGFAQNDYLTISDWFKGGVESLYTNNGGGGEQHINSRTFQPVMYENWHRV